MITYVLRRLGATLIVMALVGVLVFLLLHLAPGDPAGVIAGENASPEQIATLRQTLGLNDPLPLQFVHWAGRVLRGDLGASIYSNEPVTSLIGQRLAATISLALATLAFAVPVAVTFGVVAAYRAGTGVDRVLMLFSVIGFSLPAFVLGYVLIWLFSIQWRVLPVQGFTPIDEGVVPWALHLLLPALTLGMTYTALIARITRTAVLDVLSEDFIRTARAKGVPVGRMLIRHALRNAGVPIATVVGIGIALLMGGVVVTETVFNIPGAGRLVVDAIARRDYPVIQGVILVFSGVYVLVNLLTDLSYTLIDPRIRY